MNRLSCFLMLLFATALLGCGGGGGKPGGRGTGTLSLTFDAAPGAAAGPAGSFHKVVVYRNDGAVVQTQTVDTTAGSQSLALKGLPKGTLRLHVGLSETSGGAETGAVNTFFEGGSAPAPMVFAQKRTVVGAAVLPETGTVNVGSTLRLYAAAKDGDGEFVYVAPAAWNWTSSLPAFASVEATTGVVTGVAEGAATVTATVGAVSGSAPVSVLANGVRQGKWTVMVFLNSANDLAAWSDDNMNQMERIANNPDVRFVVQWKLTDGYNAQAGQSWTGTRRYLVNYDTKSTVASSVVQNLGEGVDMGSANRLADFVDWAKQKYPAERYALVLWDHGSGWNTPRALGAPPMRGISLDEETGNIMETWEISEALGDRRVDVLAYDACLMQGAEDLFDFAPNADYVVGSEENTPAPGFPYHKAFKSIVDDPEATGATLASGMVGAFNDHYASGAYSSWALHMSALDTSKVPALRTALDDLSLALLGAGDLGTLATDVRAACTRMDLSQNKVFYYDLDQVAERTATLTANANVAGKANALRTALANAVLSSDANSHGAHMRGVTIEFGTKAKFATYATSYAKLQLAKGTHWDEFLMSAGNP